jgi:predicted DNA-binding transcriptional regulator AlpA
MPDDAPRHVPEGQSTAPPDPSVGSGHPTLFDAGPFADIIRLCKLGVVPDLDRLIDRDEFAARLGVGVSTLDTKRAAAKVGPRGVRLGGTVRFHLAEVVEWLSTPGPTGELHDAQTWPAVWAARQKKTGPTGR